jgi:hypothetical protein
MLRRTISLSSTTNTRRTELRKEPPKHLCESPVAAIATRKQEEKRLNYLTPCVASNVQGLGYSLERESKTLIRRAKPLGWGAASPRPFVLIDIAFTGRTPDWL